MKKLSVIIVSWNCREDLDRCLRSIKASGVKHPYEVFVVDNDSADGTVDFLKTRYPDVRVIANKENRGFAAANNQAIHQAQGEYLLLLNPDTVVREDALGRMIDFMEKHGEVWAVGPRMLNADGTDQRSGVRFPSNWNVFVESLFLDRVFAGSRLFGAHRQLYVDPSDEREVDHLQGSCLMVRAGILPSVGLLDEQFFMYFEETDWCYRMRQANGKVFHLPAATVVHFGGGEIGHYDERRLLHYHKSLMLFHRKHRSKFQNLVLGAIILVRSTIRIVLWSLIALVKPSMRVRAGSIVKGYARSIVLVLGGP